MFLSKYFECGWCLAIRNAEPQKHLFEESSIAPFYVIKNPWRYWCADPFLFNYRNKSYIFCEAYDILKNKGVIAYREVEEDGSISKLKKCLECDYHLSYPFIFEYKNEVYMIPETSAIDEVELFKATTFPDKWEKVDNLINFASACDTNIISYNGKTYLLTLIFDKAKIPYVYDSLFLYEWNGDKFVACFDKPIVNNPEFARNAGKMFSVSNRLYRVSQNCKNSYGENLSFFEVDKIDSSDYEEHLIKKITLNDIILHSNNNYDGIHTYNFDDRFEIIDLQKIKWPRIERLLFLFNNKLKGLFIK